MNLIAINIDEAGSSTTLSFSLPAMIIACQLKKGIFEKEEIDTIISRISFPKTLRTQKYRIMFQCKKIQSSDHYKKGKTWDEGNNSTISLIPPP